CECWNTYVETNIPKTCSVVAEVSSCEVARDCCPDNVPEGFSCPRDYPYSYACDDGTCIAAGCVQDSDCNAYADLVGFVNMGCVESAWPCPPIPSACQVAPAPPSCAVARDCCPDPMPEGYVCLADFPYLYNCNAGFCEAQQCTRDSECHAYGAQ